jgi:hypothetical protein
MADLWSCEYFIDTSVVGIRHYEQAVEGVDCPAVRSASVPPAAASSVLSARPSTRRPGCRLS